MSATSRANKNTYLKIFLLHLAMAVIAFLPSIIMQKGFFILAGDFNSQQIPFTIHSITNLKKGLIGFDPTIDLGTDFIGAMAFYLLGSPSFYLASLFPAKIFPYLVGFLYALKYAVAGLTSYVFIRRFTRENTSAFAGSVLYAFSGFMNENLLFYHFHDVVMLFPLLLITMDDLVMKNRRGSFALAVLLNAVVNYFFLPGEIIFLAIYFCVNYGMPYKKSVYKDFFKVLGEGVIGCMMGAVLLIPAFVFVKENPRVEFDYTGSNALLFTSKRYFFILKAFLFPAEVMSDHTAVYERNFTSCAAYLPMVGLAPVFAYLKIHKDKITKILYICLAAVLVPILNASFSAFAGIYCRWYYMPILIMSLASAKVIDGVFCDDELIRKKYKNALSSGILYTILLLAFFASYLVFFKWDSETESLIYRPELFSVYVIISALGLLVTYIFLVIKSKNAKKRFMIFLVVASMLLTGGQVIAYRSAHSRTNDEYKRIYYKALDLENHMGYRYSTTDNMVTLLGNVMGTGSFCSTVQGSIFEFYEAVGDERSVKAPKAPDGFDILTSAAYKEDVKDSLDYVKDESIPPIGFTYDSYITRTELDETVEDNKAMTMLRTLVIDDDKEDTVKEILEHEENPFADESDKEWLAEERKMESSSYFHIDNKGFESEITCSDDKYAFFSIPNSKGWSAFVNDEPSEILNVCGFMAVRVNAGDNRIVFKYKTPGLTLGIVTSVLFIIIFALYVIYFKKLKKRA